MWLTGSLEISSFLHHRRNNRRDRGRLAPQLLRWGATMYWSRQLLCRSFHKATNITASSHQNAGFSIWVFKNFPGVLPPYLHSGRGIFSRLLAGRGAQAPRCWDPNLGPPQLFSCGCAPVLHVHIKLLAIRWYNQTTITAAINDFDKNMPFCHEISVSGTYCS